MELFSRVGGTFREGLPIWKRKDLCVPGLASAIPKGVFQPAAEGDTLPPCAKENPPGVVGRAGSVKLMVGPDTQRRRAGESRSGLLGSTH